MLTKANYYMIHYNNSYMIHTYFDSHSNSATDGLIRFISNLIQIIWN